jgi:hypothetical protein
VADVSGIVNVQGLPRDNASVKLFPASSFATPPVKGTAFPVSGQVGSTATSGDAHGGDGAYRFTSVPAGRYYAGADWNGTIVWDSHEVSADVEIPWLNASDYGAVGDGTTDDAGAIQDAIDAAEAAGGGAVVIPSTADGYLLNSQLLISASNVELIGDGTHLINGQSANPVITILGLVGTHITGIRVAGFRFSRAGGVGSGNNNHIDLRYVDNSLVENIYSDNAGIDGVFLRNCEEVTFRNVIVNNPRVIGILAFECERVSFENCRTADAGVQSGAGFGLQFKNCVGCRMVNCVAVDSEDYGLYVFDDGTGSVRTLDNTLIGCHVDGAGVNAIYVNNSKRTNIIGCEARNSTGAGIDVSQSSDHAVVSGCTAVLNGATGIVIGGGGGLVTGNFCFQNVGSGILITTSATKCTVTGNRCIDNGYPLSPLVYSGIQLDTNATDNTVCGNVCGRIDTTNSKQLYAVEEVSASGAARNVVIGNTAFDNLTAAYRREATDSVFLNDEGSHWLNGTTFQWAVAGTEKLALSSTALTLADAVNIAVNTTTGTKIGTATTQKLSFYNATPVVRPTAPTAADAGVIDAVYGAEEAAVLENVRTRLGEVITKLQTLGLIG